MSKAQTRTARKPRQGLSSQADTGFEAFKLTDWFKPPKVWWTASGVLLTYMILREGVEQVKLSYSQQEMKALITKIAKQLGVPVNVALAFAWLESRFNPNAEGDLQWAVKSPEIYQEIVLNSEKFKNNPWRNDKLRWHSYGLFQLLAPYIIQANEDPKILLDPTINATRGIQKLKNLLTKHNGDAYKARIDFAGAGNLADSYKNMLTSKLNEALKAVA